MKYLGIDVSKDKFNVSVSLWNGEFENNQTGFKSLIKWLKKKKIELSYLHCCLEATGRYGEELALYLSDKEIKVSIVNPACIHAFGQSQLKRNKTDKIDAQLIARFCEVNQPPAWIPPSAEMREMRELIRLIESFEEEKQRHKNRLESRLFSEASIQAINQAILGLESQIEQLEMKVKELINKDNDLKGKVSLLQTIPGIGEKSAIRFIAEIPNIENYTKAKCLAATFGITPKQRLSGSSINSSSISKLGNKRLRKAFFLPALSAKLHNPIIKNFCKQLSERGKKAKQIICAAMRKLIHIVYGVLKSGKPFDPNYQNLSFSS